MDFPRLGGGLAALLLSFAAAAAEVGALVEFAPNTPARAAEVNANFSALKTAVDDNDSRLNTLEADAAASDGRLDVLELEADASDARLDALEADSTDHESRLTAVESGKQNRVTGSCSVGSAVTAVAADGSVTCAPLGQDGFVSVSQDAFRSSYAGCVYNISNSTLGGYFTGGEYDTCTALASVNLPHGANIDSFSCLVRDSHASARIYEVGLMQQRLDNAYLTIITSSASSTGNAVRETLTGTGSFSPWPVDNENQVYRIRVIYQASGDPSGVTFNDVTSNLQLWGCKVGYSY